MLVCISKASEDTNIEKIAIFDHPVPFYASENSREFPCINLNILISVYVYLASWTSDFIVVVCLKISHFGSSFAAVKYFTFSIFSAEITR